MVCKTGLLLSVLFFSVCAPVAPEASAAGEERAGVVREVALPEGVSSAQSMAIDAAGRIWFVEKVGRQLIAFDPDSGDFDTYTLPDSWGGMGFSKIALSPDGDIWFSVNRWAEGADEPHMLGRFTPSDGYFTRYVFSIEAYPEEVLIDDNGVIWFSAANKNSLYRVDPVAFTIKGYAIPSANSYPNSLAVDKNGDIWFVEASVNKIGKFVPGRELFYEYEVPTAFANPGKIAIDSEGKIWFVEMAANRLGVFYPGLRRFDEAIIPTANSAPNALVHDNDGNVWFLEYRGNKVGCFNPKSAVFREFDIPNFNSLPGDMVLDRKRSMLWFTQSATEARSLGSLSIHEALAGSEK